MRNGEVCVSFVWIRGEVCSVGEFAGICKGCVCVAAMVIEGCIEKVNRVCVIGAFSR